MNREQEQPVASKYNPEMVNRMKKEIMQDLETRREWQEEYYGPDRGYRGNQRGPAGGRYNYPPPPMHQNRRVPEVDYDWWVDREEYDYQRNQALLRNQLRRELESLDKMNRRMGQISDPEVRRLLAELLQEARTQGVGVQDLIQSLNMSNPGVAGSLVNRVTGPLKGVDRRSFGWGVGAALLGLMLLPTLAKSVRSLSEKAASGTMDLTERAQGVFEMAKEEFEDIVAEAKFNKLKDSVVDNIDVTGKGQPPSK